MNISRASRIKDREHAIAVAREHGAGAVVSEMLQLLETERSHDRYIMARAWHFTREDRRAVRAMYKYLRKKGEERRDAEWMADQIVALGVDADTFQKSVDDYCSRIDTGRERIKAALLDAGEPERAAMIWAGEIIRDTGIDVRSWVRVPLRIVR